MKRVGFCNSKVILGGRQRVVRSMAAVLNEIGIVPDMLTKRVMFDPKTEDERYTGHVDLKYREIDAPRVPGELRVVLFNRSLKHYAAEYDLLINVNNCLIHLPETDIISYVFYPRKSRIMAPVRDIHIQESVLHPHQWYWWYRELLRSIYKNGSRGFKLSPRHRIICMTEFTRQSVRDVYDVDNDLPIIYPGIELSEYAACGQQRDRAVATMGRFTPGKRQLEQIRLAETLPEVPFHIVGFARGNSYFRECDAYVRSRKLSNVHLHPDMPFEEAKKLLQRTEYFLHTLVNEPFGLTSVQAMAAGCIPIVHDSGGQRETVINRELRYTALPGAARIIRRLDTLDQGQRESLRTDIGKHIRQFDEAVFRDAFRAQLMDFWGMDKWSTD